MLYSAVEYKKFENIIYGKDKTQKPKYPYNLYLALEPVYKRRNYKKHEPYLGLNAIPPYSEDIIEGLNFAIQGLTTVSRLLIVKMFMNGESAVNIAHELYPDEYEETANKLFKKALAKALNELADEKLIHYIEYGKKGNEQRLRQYKDFIKTQNNEPIETINISIRSIHALKRNNINTVGELIGIMKTSPEYIHRIAGIGNKSWSEIKHFANTQR